MVQDLTAVVLLVLHWVVAEVELSQQVELLDVLELEDFGDVVESEIQEAKALDILKPSQVSNVVLREVEFLEIWQVAQARDLADLILCQVEVF